MTVLHIDIFSDVVCPWCFIGKRHLDQALALWRTEHPHSEVVVTWPLSVVGAIWPPVMP